MPKTVILKKVNKNALQKTICHTLKDIIDMRFISHTYSFMVIMIYKSCDIVTSYLRSTKTLCKNTL